jgi:hypothetical protein
MYRNISHITLLDVWPQDEKAAREAAEARVAQLEADLAEAKAAAQAQVCSRRHLKQSPCRAIVNAPHVGHLSASAHGHPHDTFIAAFKVVCNGVGQSLSEPAVGPRQTAAELEAAAGERDQLRAQLAEQQAAAAEAAREADAARAAVQGEVNTARQRIQAAEKARLELEVGIWGFRLGFCLVYPSPKLLKLSSASTSLLLRRPVAL